MAQLTEITKFFEKKHPLNKDGLAELLALFETRQYDKGAVIITEGQQETHLRFMNHGGVREYYATPEKETNINFYTEPQFLTDLMAFDNDLPTRRYQEVLAHTEVLLAEKGKFRLLLEKYDCGKAFIAASFQKILQCKELVEYKRSTCTPEALYKDMLTERPHWLRQVPQYHIASYLNITPETLSRIRKRIY